MQLFITTKYFIFNFSIFVCGSFLFFIFYFYFSYSALDSVSILISYEYYILLVYLIRITNKISDFQNSNLLYSSTYQNLPLISTHYFALFFDLLHIQTLSVLLFTFRRILRISPYTNVSIFLFISIKKKYCTYIFLILFNFISFLIFLISYNFFPPDIKWNGRTEEFAFISSYDADGSGMVSVYERFVPPTSEGNQ